MPVSKILELYARNGHSLIDNGLNEAALPLADADTALQLFSQQRWHVLGGDVYRLDESGRFEPTYENWFYDGVDGLQSVAVARDFVSGLAGRPVYIVFVVEDRD
ncbi:Imm40 family immunity protein [Paraburkholderia caledonica]|jgi:hypothetical protein|uniref:Imm40 family immunity protein n=1 Tax=Paraburkholderia caledonica TaxID=134536 RepID=UPI0012EBDE82|nr:Imm40 family immunity protein [Paraburkholderia caledonica]